MIQHSDILVIGGGPVGLYAAFYAALRGLTVRIVEARAELGGQLTALYPEKFVYDAPGFPEVRAAHLAASLAGQLARFSPSVHLGEVAVSLDRTAEHWHVTTNRSAYAANAVILTAGIGALLPRALSVPGGEEFGRVETDEVNVEAHAGRRVLVYGGVPQATSAALRLHDVGASVVLGHRRASFRGTPEQLERLHALRSEGSVDVLGGTNLERFTETGAILGGIHREFDAAYVLNGYLPDLSPLSSWPLTWSGEYVVCGAGGETSLPGVFVAGDLSSNGGDMKLLSAGFAQGALAANHAVHFVRPDLKVKPGHSSDRKVPPLRTP